VKNGQLLVELALGLSEFIKPRPSLSMGGAVMRCQLRVGAA
jgi:hypothetical protein